MTISRRLPFPDSELRNAALTLRLPLLEGQFMGSVESEGIQQGALAGPGDDLPGTAPQPRLTITHDHAGVDQRSVLARFVRNLQLQHEYKLHQGS